MRIWRPGRCTTESQLIYRFCQEKAGIGIDADIHEESELPEGLRKIELCDAIPWKKNRRTLWSWQLDPARLFRQSRD
ncbi:hypothetical protein WMO41_13310 [Ventrimonas sp. CLA-AP-H27]|uniref:Uncharacterized protein n=1 Tax=Ventrimonas faecis TaxID=3133170 RepID=A0ABV1HP74_9FIRM